MLLLLDTLLLALPAFVLTDLARPRSRSGQVAAFGVFLFGLIVVVSEIAGRLSYTATGLTAGSAVLGAAGAAAIVLRRDRYRGTWHRYDPRRGLRRAVADWPTRVLLALWVLLVAYSLAAIVVLPPVVPDVLRYHLPMVVGWSQQGHLGIVGELDYRANYFPHNIELLNGWCWVLGDADRLACLAQVAISGVGWPVVCFMALRGCGLSRNQCLLGALLASLNAPVVLQMRNEMTDVGFYAAFVLAIVVALRRRQLYGAPWLVFGAAAGLALGSKSSGPLALAVCLVAWCAGLLWHVRWRLRMAVARRAAGELAGAAVVIAATGCWVFGVNTLRYGNPMYPIGVRLGPVQLATPDESHPIHYNPWMTDFGHSPLARVAGGVSRWPALFLSLPPFDRFRSAGSGGFGFVTTACFVLAVVLPVFVAVRFHSPRGLSARFNMFSVLFVGLVLAWNLLFLAMVSLTTAPWSLVDGRYQLHFVLLFAMVPVQCLGALWPGVRRAVVWGLVVVALITSRLLLVDAPQRGWKLFRAVALQGRDRLYVYTGRPFYVSNEPRKLLERLGDEPLIVNNRGRVFPFYFPTFERRIYPVSPAGADQRLVQPPDVPPEILRRSIDNLRASRTLLDQDITDARQWREVNLAFARRETVMAGAFAFYEALARRHHVRYFYTDAGLFPPMDRSPDWELVLHETGRAPGQEMALYRFAGLELGETR